MNEDNVNYTDFCLLKLIGGKWKVRIICNLLTGTKRFNELQHLLDRITPKVLTSQLEELEQSGLIIKKAYPIIPRKVEYSLSEIGLSLIPLINLIHGWSVDYMEKKSFITHNDFYSIFED